MAASAYTKENPSERYVELGRIYRQVHEAGLPEGKRPADLVFNGKSLYDHIPRVKALAVRTGARTILDYGSGKGVLYGQRNLALPDGTKAASVQEYWGVASIRCYDPGVPEFSAAPTTTHDGVVCTDVLEHIPEEDVPWFLGELFRLANRFVYANIASYPAAKTLPNGWNAHVTVRPPAWWEQQVRLAAQDWDGEAFEFQVRERRTGLPSIVRRIARIPKWRDTTIEGGRGKPAAADGAVLRAN